MIFNDYIFDEKPDGMSQFHEQCEMCGEWDIDHEMVKNPNWAAFNWVCKKCDVTFGHSTRSDTYYPKED